MKGEPVYAQPKAGKIGNQSLADGDKQFKLAVACVWVEWLSTQKVNGFYDGYYHDQILPMNDLHANTVHYKKLQLDHIKNKTHGNRYDLLNAQLITPKQHDIKTNSGEYTDYRPKEYITWLKEKLK